MKTLNFRVSIEFTEKLTSDDDMMTVANNVLRAIVDEADNGMGIAPDESEALTSVITVSPEFLDEKVSKKVF